MTICERHSGGRILCIRLSGLGDVVHALNALSLLRRERPDAHIAWLVEDRFRGLLRGHPCIDELIGVPRGAWTAMAKNPLRWWELGSELRQFGLRLRRAKFDISVDFQSSLKSAWLVLAAGAELRVGFDRGVNREFNLLSQNRLVRAPRTGVHRIERDLALLAPLGIPTRYADPVLPVSRADSEAMDRALAGRLTGGPMVVVHPGTSKSAAFKRWDPGRYARVADRLVAERNADVVLSYGPQEKELAEQVLGLMRRRGLLAPPTENLQQLTRLLSRADLFIGSDTGPMHIASALQVPVVALFGPKDPVQTGPYCGRSIVVTAPVDCRPCTKRRCSHVRCMRNITPTRVAQAALDLLDGGGRCPAADGLIRKPMTVGFRLGRWQGQIATCYSRPEFYARLCEPDAIISASDAKVIRAGQSRCSASVPASVEGPVDRFFVKRYYPKRGLYYKLGDLLMKPRARNSWDCARRLLMAGIPVPFHVCYMEKGRGWGRHQLLIAEDVTGVRGLCDWLAPDGPSHWSCAPHMAKREALQRAAALLRGLHSAGFYHADLRADNVLICPRGSTPETFIIDIDRMKRVGWLPPLLRDIFYGVDLRRFAQSLKVRLTVAEAARFFRDYCRGFIREPHRQRLIRDIVLRSQRGSAGRRKRSLWLARTEPQHGGKGAAV